MMQVFVEAKYISNKFIFTRGQIWMGAHKNKRIPLSLLESILSPGDCLNHTVFFDLFYVPVKRLNAIMPKEICDTPKAAYI